MYKLGTKVQFKIENMEYIGKIDMIQVNPILGITNFIVSRKNGESYSLLEGDLKPYVHSHISNAFCRSFYVEE